MNGPVVMTAELSRDDLCAAVRIACASPERARALQIAISAALDDRTLEVPATVRTLHLRTRKRALALTPELAADAVVVVAVSERNARHLLAIVEAVRQARPLGVQLAWDGTSRDRIEPHVFAVLEHARSTPKLGPVILATTGDPCFNMRLLAARNEPRGKGGDLRADL